MSADRKLRLCESRDLQVLELPYVGGSTSMMIVLPRQGVELGLLEQALDPDSLASWSSRLRTTFVRVALPKFQVEQAYELARVLGTMGMGEVFTPDADFSGIAHERPLFLSHVFHKAIVQVDERGTEAAAGTALLYRGIVGIGSAQPVLFVADHPFLFLIRSLPSGAILFMGRVADPS